MECIDVTIFKKFNLHQYKLDKYTFIICKYLHENTQRNIFLENIPRILMFVGETIWKCILIGFSFSYCQKTSYPFQGNVSF